ncbi:Bug family tripartite tricarboxylate transporter substrate binding protein [Devosia sp. A369]
MTSNMDFKKPDRRQVLKGAMGMGLMGAMAGTGLLGATSAAFAQADWRPSGPVKLVVPFPPGGGSDTLARAMAPGASERLGQPCIVENRPGATGSIGTANAYDARPDGMTLLVAVSDVISVWPQISPSNVDVTRFVPIVSLGTSSLLLFGRSDLPANNLSEFIALAQKGGMRYASAGIGGIPHLVTEAFIREAGIPDVVHAPYPGMAPALQALLGKQVDFMLIGVGGSLQHIPELKVFGIVSAARHPVLPDVPTLTEQGIPLVSEAWYCMVAPPGTPEPVANVLSQVFSEATADPAFTALLDSYGILPLALPKDELAPYFAEDYRKWGELVKASNIKL